MTDFRKLLDEGGCEDNHGCHPTTCVCALAGDMVDEIERQKAAIDQLLTCGNHIALYRTGRWPDYVLGGLTREQQCENALRTLGATQEYDLWCCWSGMMQTRDALSSGERQ